MIELVALGAMLSLVLATVWSVRTGSPRTVTSESIRRSARARR